MNRDVVRLIGIGLAVTAVIVAAGLAIDWFPTAASVEAGEIDSLFDVVLVASIPFFVLVEVVVLYCVWRFRMRPGQENMDGPPIHGNTRLEVFWTAIPALLLVGLCTYTFFTLEKIEKKSPRELIVNVTGQQFTWTFQYPQGGRQVTSNQLYLPIDQRVRFNVRTKDVVHDFWVPQFRMKIDAVPGVTTQYRVTPNRLGNYAVVCAELCGLGHATMRQTAHVVRPAAFRRWLAGRRAGGAAAAAGGAAGAGAKPAGGAAAVGKQVFTGDAGCGGCHVLADAGTAGQTGPNLDKVLKGRSAAQIRQDIVDPNAQIAKGFGANIMPTSFGQTLSRQELNGVVQYLQQATQK